MVPLNAPIIQLVNPGCQIAIDRAVHEVDTERFHRRVTGACPYCLTLGEKLRRAFADSVSGSDIATQAKERIQAVMEAQDERDRQGSDA
jgi:hypothetical protein